MASIIRIMAALLLMTLTGAFSTLHCQENPAAESDLPLGFENAKDIVAGETVLSLRMTQQLHIVPKMIICNGEYYGILNENNQIYRTRNLRDFTRLISISYDNDPDAVVNSFDLEGDTFLVVTPEKIHLVSPEEQVSRPNTRKIISAVLLDGAVHAINRNETFNDLENLIKVVKDDQIIDSRAWPVGIKSHIRNTAATYLVRKTEPGSYAIFSRLTGEVIPTPEDDISVEILNDPRALARVRYNMDILQEYVESMSVKADYTNVISDVLVHQGTAYAIFMTSDHVYWKRLDQPQGQEHSWRFKFTGWSLVGLVCVEGRLELFVTQENRYKIHKYAIGLEP